MGERQPRVQWREARLGARADQRRDEHETRHIGRARRGPQAREGKIARATGKPGEGQQERHRADRRHDEIDMPGVAIGGVVVARHHQRPGRQRHQFPEKQKGIDVVGDQNEIHRRREGRKQGLHAGRQFMVAIETEAVNRRRGDADIDDQAEKGGKRVEPQAQARGGQAERQNGADIRRLEDRREIGDGPQRRGQQAGRIDQPEPTPARRRGEDSRRQIDRDGDRKALKFKRSRGQSPVARANGFAARRTTAT